MSILLPTKDEAKAGNYHSNSLAKAGTVITGLSTATGILNILGLGNSLLAAVFGLILGTNLQITSTLMEIAGEEA
ncbi:MAG: hypothetical protein ABEK04_03665 [Candidatus Nanohalobium sp.]